MPRFFFHLSGERARRDEEGFEFPDTHAAWSEAVRTCGEMIRDQYRTLEPARAWVMEVIDEDGRRVFSLSFGGSVDERR